MFLIQSRLFLKLKHFLRLQPCAFSSNCVPLEMSTQWRDASSQMDLLIYFLKNQCQAISKWTAMIKGQEMAASLDGTLTPGVPPPGMCYFRQIACKAEPLFFFFLSAPLLKDSAFLGCSKQPFKVNISDRSQNRYLQALHVQGLSFPNSCPWNVWRQLWLPLGPLKPLGIFPTSLTTGNAASPDWHRQRCDTTETFPGGGLGWGDTLRCWFDLPRCHVTSRE